MKRRTVLLLLPTAVAGGVFLTKFLFKRFSNAWGGLDSVVSFSARKIAATRAREAEKGKDALVSDPLARILAGTKAMAMTTAPSSSESGSIGRIIMRTVFFDDAIKASCSPNDGSPAMFRELSIALGSSSGPHQVVLLGSGMDSRPWRLDCISGAHWYEVDREDVLKVKKRVLGKAGASLEGNKRGCKYPLCCKSWSGVPLDLEEQGWTNKLIEAGFDPSLPTCWVLEGLLYYLDPSAVPLILCEAAQVSAPGSTLFASIVSYDFVEELKTREVYKDKQSIMSGWKWGCPGEPADYFGASKWKVLSCPSWQEVAGVYRLKPSYEGKPAGGRKNSVLYVTALIDR